MTRALIVVDVQNDFTIGSLAVPGGVEIAYRIANTMLHYGPGGKSPRYDYMVATKDWHLRDSSNAGHFDLWPEHCIQGTEGALFHEALDPVVEKFDAIFYKGQGFPGYSGFHGTTPVWPDEAVFLNDWLNERGVTHVDIVGIATDYCVKDTAIDAIAEGFEVRIPALLTVAVGGLDASRRVIETVNAFQGHLTRIN